MIVHIDGIFEDLSLRLSAWFVTSSFLLYKHCKARRDPEFGSSLEQDVTEFCGSGMGFGKREVGV